MTLCTSISSFSQKVGGCLTADQLQANLAKQSAVTKHVSEISFFNLNLAVDSFDRICLKFLTQSRLDASVLETAFKFVNNGSLDLWYNSYNPANSYFSIEIALESDYSSSLWERNQFLYQTLADRSESAFSNRQCQFDMLSFGVPARHLHTRCLSGDLQFQLDPADASLPCGAWRVTSRLTT